MSHLLADTHKELLAMVDLIGVKRQWIQKEGKPDEHFDICRTKRVAAIYHGAKEVSPRELVEIIKRKRSAISTKEVRE
jgi:hypothetical protein